MGALRDQLARAIEPPSEVVQHAGIEFVMRGLSITEQIELEAFEDPVEAGFRAIELCVVDEDGVRVFEDGDPALRAMDARYLEFFGDVLKRLNSPDAVAGNSGAAQSSDG